MPSSNNVGLANIGRAHTSTATKTTKTTIFAAITRMQPDT